MWEREREGEKRNEAGRVCFLKLTHRKRVFLWSSMAGHVALALWTPKGHGNAIARENTYNSKIRPKQRIFTARTQFS